MGNNLQKDFNQAFESRKSIYNQIATRFKEAAAFKHFLAALSYYTKTLDADQIETLEHEIRWHEFVFTQPENLEQLAGVVVDVGDKHFRAWYQQEEPMENILAFSGDVSLNELYRFAKTILPAGYFGIDYTTQLAPHWELAVVSA
mgnify:CR=1 FL=1